MKIGIYARHTFFNILGGTEICQLMLAEGLSRDHKVEIVHHKASLDKNKIARAWGMDLKLIHFRYVKLNKVKPSNPRKPQMHYDDHSTDEEISKPYDLFVNFEHNIPLFCHASIGVLYVLFPLVDRADFRPFNKDNVASRQTYERLSSFLWNKRFDSYQIRMANSDFTRQWTQKRWGIDCAVNYNPVNTSFDSTAKDNIILSIGRFTSSEISKKQKEMLAVFQKIKGPEARDWECFCVGSFPRNNRKDRDYYEALRFFETDSRVHIMANCPDREKLRLLERAKIFWLATGFGEDEEAYPERCEHFGIATVEAMAAGCVPVVINKGGQPEIVQHGVNGFLWNTSAELIKYTTLLMRDESLFMKMSQKARQRAEFFSQKNFIGRFMKTLKPVKKL